MYGQLNTILSENNNYRAAVIYTCDAYDTREREREEAETMLIDTFH